MKIKIKIFGQVCSLLILIIISSGSIFIASAHSEEPQPNALYDILYRSWNNAIAYSPDCWQAYPVNIRGGTVLQVSSEDACEATLTFYGKGIDYYGTLGPMGGKANVYVDNVYKSRINFYDRRAKMWQLLFSQNFNIERFHTIRIVNSGFKERASSGHYIAIDYFSVSSSKKSELIEDTTVTIDPDNGIIGIGEATANDSVIFRIRVSEYMRNDDKSLGDVTIDTTRLGDPEYNYPLYNEDYKLSCITNCEDLYADFYEYGSPSIPIGVTGVSISLSNVDFEVTAENDRGSEVFTTDAISIEN